jgi:hypothetical protein
MLKLAQPAMEIPNGSTVSARSASAKLPWRSLLGDNISIQNHILRGKADCPPLKGLRGNSEKRASPLWR